MPYGGNNEVYGQTRASIVEQKVYQEALEALRQVQVPTDLQALWDYGVRTDGLPNYAGYAERGIETSASGWLIHHFTYNASGHVTQRAVAYDAWDDRTGATYA